MTEQSNSEDQLQERVEELKEQEKETAWKQVEDYANEPGLGKTLALSDCLKAMEAEQYIYAAETDLKGCLKEGDDFEKELERSELIAAKVNFKRIESEIMDRRADHPGYSTAHDRWKEKIHNYELVGGKHVISKTDRLLKDVIQRDNKSQPTQNHKTS